MRSTAALARRLIANAAALLLSLVLTGLAIEAALRWVPGALPSGTDSMGQRFSPEIQSAVYTGPVIYNKVRRTSREPNGEGFLDVEHAAQKPAGSVRIGFFGDSYVESAQVPLEQTFFRRLAASPSEPRIEPIAFGISGWGTLHSLLAYRALAERHQLDAVVYVFVENDPGDNAFSIQGGRVGGYYRRPFAELSESAPGFRVRWAENLQETRLARWLRAAYDRSVLARVVWSRLVLLRSRGTAARMGADGVAQRYRGQGPPDQNDLRASWPQGYRQEAEELARRILRRFAEEARESGRSFAVLYVPRGEAQLDGRVPDAETWKPWLAATCAENGIPLIDPTPELRAALADGRRVYDDHFAPAGHEALAAALLRDLPPLLHVRAGGAAVGVVRSEPGSYAMPRQTGKDDAATP